MSGVLYLQSSEQVQANCILKLGHLFFFPAISTFSDYMFAGLSKKIVHIGPASGHLPGGGGAKKGLHELKPNLTISLPMMGLTVLQIMARLLQQA